MILRAPVYSPGSKQQVCVQCKKKERREVWAPIAPVYSPGSKQQVGVQHKKKERREVWASMAHAAAAARENKLFACMDSILHLISS